VYKEKNPCFDLLHQWASTKDNFFHLICWMVIVEKLSTNARLSFNYPLHHAESDDSVTPRVHRSKRRKVNPTVRKIEEMMEKENKREKNAPI
jgi:hypothetical protein